MIVKPTNKKLITIVVTTLIVALLATASYGASAFSNTNTQLNNSLGDIDGQNGVRIKDAVLLQRHIVKLTILTDEQLAAGDVNADGKINLKDVVYIQKKLAHLIDKFPAEETNSEGIQTSSSSSSEQTSSDTESTNSGGITSGGYIDGFY